MSAINEQIGGNHYKEMAIQPIEFCQRNRLGYAESLAIKYICRHQRKHGKQDIDKAIHCLELLKELEYTVSVKPEHMELNEAIENAWLNRED